MKKIFDKTLIKLLLISLVGFVLLNACIYYTIEQIKKEFQSCGGISLCIGKELGRIKKGMEAENE